MVNTKEKELSVVFNKYINECRFSARLSKETIKGYKNTFELFEKIMPEVTSVELLTKSSLVEFFKILDNRPRKVGKCEIRVGVKKTTVKTYWTKLNTFFNWIKENKLIEENPLKGSKPPRVRYDDFKRLTDDEVNKIFSSIILHPSDILTLRRNTVMVSLLANLGIRKGEFISLKITDLDLYKREVTIRGETSKSGITRVLKINNKLLMHIKDYLNERNRQGYKTENLIVSSKKDKGLSRDGLKHWVEKIKEISGVKFHLHQFRHTFACKLVEVNINIYKIQKLMGHANITMTVKYLRSLKTEDMGEDIEKISF